MKPIKGLSNWLVNSDGIVHFMWCLLDHDIAAKVTPSQGLEYHKGQLLPDPCMHIDKRR